MKCAVCNSTSFVTERRIDGDNICKNCGYKWKTSSNAKPKDNGAFNVDEVFSYHAPKGDQAIRYELIRTHAKYMAEKIMGNCPPSRERALALTNLQQAIMWANASIAINE